MNNRSAQLLAATLAFLLIVLVGATIFILLSRPAPGPTATPSGGPSSTPTGGPSSSGTPRPSFSFPLESPTGLPPTDTPSPTLEPTITPTPSPSPTPSPTPSPSPTLPPPGDNVRQLTVVDVGLDQRSDPAGVQRSIQFGVDGPSVITAQLSGVNAGKVRMCLVRNEPAQKECIVAHAGTLTIPVYDAGSSRWNLTLLGVSGVPGQYATASVDFNAISPDVRLDSFRFNGTDDPRYNGFQLVLRTGGPGSLNFHAAFDGALDSYEWHLNVAVDDVAVYDESGGPSTFVDRGVEVDAGTAYSVTFEEPEAVAGGGALPAFVDARLIWP